MTSLDYVNLSLAMYVPLQRFAVDSFIMLMSDRARTISEILSPPACTDLEGIGVKVQCKITFSSQQQACTLTVTQIHV